MTPKTLSQNIKALLKKEPILTHVDIAKKLKIDKAKASGYLHAMADYGDIESKKIEY